MSRTEPRPANRIAWFRKAKGLSLRELAYELHELDPTPRTEGRRLPPDASTIGRWERGLTGVPDHWKLLLADLFGVSVVYLMGWEDQPNGDGGERERNAA